MLKFQKVCVDSLGFSIYVTISSAYSLPIFFPIWLPLIHFSDLIAVASPSKTILNKSHVSGKSGQLCLAPDLRKFSVFTTEYDIDFTEYGIY